MDLNLVRLRLPLEPVAQLQMQAALLGPCSSFEQPLAQLCSRSLSNDPELVRRHQKPGLPFVFSLPADGQLDCLLTGPAIAELPLFLSTVAHLSGSPPICSFSALDYQGQPVALTADGGDELPVLSLAELLDMATPCYASCQRLRITLQSPLRLMAEGRELNRFEPIRLVRSVLRRVSSLAAYYGMPGEPENVVRLSGFAGRLRASEVQSFRSSPDRGSRGVLGSCILQGPVDELGPWLQLGGLLHVGKAASYGQGAFQVTPLS